MANRVTGQVLGSGAQTFDQVFTPDQVLARLNDGDVAGFTCSINGVPSPMSTPLQDMDYLTFSKSVKNG